MCDAALFIVNSKFNKIEAKMKQIVISRDLMHIEILIKKVSILRKIMLLTQNINI